MGDSKNKRKSKFPPNVSANYYTDPAYSTDAFYGFEDHRNSDEAENLNQSLHDGASESVDEPVESWGWINNVDKRHL